MNLPGLSFQGRKAAILAGGPQKISGIEFPVGWLATGGCLT